MRLNAPHPLWERPVMRTVAGDTLRPGGLSLTDRGAELAGVVPGWQVLDVGCGLGATVKRLRSRFGAHAYGVDSSPAQVREANDPQVVTATAQCLPFADGVFQAVFSECVLSLVPDTEAGVREWYRVLAPGGVLVLADLCGHGSNKGDSCSDRAKPLSYIRECLHNAGFSIGTEEDHTHLLKELAANLILAGVTEQACSCSGPMGYYLLTAYKDGASHDG